MTAIANTVVRPDRVLPGPLRHEANHRGPGAGQRRAPHEQHVAGNRADGPGGRDPDDPHPDAPEAPRRPLADHNARRWDGTGTQADPRRDAGQGARPCAPLATADRERSDLVDHRPRRAGGCDRPLCVPAPTAHLPRARHRRGDPRRAAAEGAQACRDARKWAVGWGEQRHAWGFSQGSSPCA